MHTLHAAPRAMRGDTMTRRDHLDVFREFLDRLDRAARRRPPAVRAGRPKGKARRGKR
jgi:hypothetical protein